MCNKELIPLVEQYRKRELENFNQLYAAFERLLGFYGRHLPEDDAVQELTVFWIELLDRLPLERFDMDESAQLNRYIAVSIRNRYIAISKEHQTRNALCTTFCEDIAADVPDTVGRADLAAALGRLTDKQRQVIKGKYFYGYSDAELSQAMHITRQAVNRLKTRGLALLHSALVDEQTD